MLNEAAKWDFRIDTGTSSHQGAIVRINPESASDVTGRMQPYKSFPYKLRPALEAVADYVRGTMIPRVFEEEGPGWKRLARRTQRERAAQGYGAQHPILRRSGDLYQELTKKSHPGHIEVIKTGKFARVEISGSSDKFIRNQAGNKELHIPSRPMIPGTGHLALRDYDRQQIKAIMKKKILETLNK